MSHPLLTAACFALLLSGAAPAAAAAHDDPVADSRGPVADYRVPRAARAALVGMKATVLHGSAGGDYTARLDAEQVATLRRLGFRPEPVPASTNTQEAGGGYTSYAQKRADFQAYAAAHPDLARYVVLGHSVQGREIFALRITAAPEKEEDEPELLFCGSIHGDEFASGEVTYLYALHLLDSYGSDPAVTQWVDTSEIWCVPLVNPDGHEAGTRNNANGVDLNRDYGHQWDGWGNSPGPHSQPESVAMRELFRANAFSLVATLHCSGNVLFYPWGFSPWSAPDLATITRVGLRYSQAANYGLVNSWTDYETHGEVLDDIYGSHGGLCYTVEISNVLSQFANTWSRNKAGMDAFCASMQDGLHVKVRDARTGLPLHASVRVSGSLVPSYTDPARGDAHRIVLPGTYEVTVDANGHRPAVVSNVVVASGAPAQLEVELARGGRDHAFRILAVDQRDPQDAYANVTDPQQALGPPDGVPCSLGTEGFLVLDLGAGHEAHDGPGADLTVHEALVPGDALPEAYLVYGGDASAQDVPLGAGLGTTDFDLAGTGLSSVRYLRIVDASGAPPSGPLAGVDLDAVTVLNGNPLQPDDAAKAPAP